MNRSIILFTASQQFEAAQESAEYGGHFTYGFVEGMKGEAVGNGTNVKIEDLADHITDTVEKLSRFGGVGRIRQHPGIMIPDGFRNFIIAEIQ